MLLQARMRTSKPIVRALTRATRVFTRTYVGRYARRAATHRACVRRWGIAIMVESKHLAFFFVVGAAIVALAAFVSKQPGGWIKTAGGSICSWRIEGDAVSDRAMKLDCHCPGKNDREVAYSCKYVGKPTKTCWLGLKKKIMEFFYEMIDTIKG